MESPLAIEKVASCQHGQVSPAAASNCAEHPTPARVVARWESVDTPSTAVVVPSRYGVTSAGPVESVRSGDQRPNRSTSMTNADISSPLRELSLCDHSEGGGHSLPSAHHSAAAAGKADGRPQWTPSDRDGCGWTMTIYTAASATASTATPACPLCVDAGCGDGGQLTRHSITASDTALPLCAVDAERERGECLPASPDTTASRGHGDEHTVRASIAADARVYSTVPCSSAKPVFSSSHISCTNARTDVRPPSGHAIIRQRILHRAVATGVNWLARMSPKPLHWMPVDQLRPIDKAAPAVHCQPPVGTDVTTVATVSTAASESVASSEPGELVITVADSKQASADATTATEVTGSMSAAPDSEASVPASEAAAKAVSVATAVSSAVRSSADEFPYTVGYHASSTRHQRHGHQAVTFQLYQVFRCAEVGTQLTNVSRFLEHPPVAACRMRHRGCPFETGNLEVKMSGDAMFPLGTAVIRVANSAATSGTDCVHGYDAAGILGTDSPTHHPHDDGDASAGNDGGDCRDCLDDVVDSARFDYMSSVPPELLWMILLRCDGMSLRQLSMTSHKMRSACYGVLERKGMVESPWQQVKPSDGGRPKWRQVDYFVWSFSTASDSAQSWLSFCTKPDLRRHESEACLYHAGDRADHSEAARRHGAWMASMQRDMRMFGLLSAGRLKKRTAACPPHYR